MKSAADNMSMNEHGSDELYLQKERLDLPVCVACGLLEEGQAVAF